MSDFDLSGAIIDHLGEAKPWWQSRTIIGSLITVVASLAALLGWHLDTAVATELALGLAGLIGGALAWYGRVKATRPISRTKVVPGLELNR